MEQTKQQEQAKSQELINPEQDWYFDGYSVHQVGAGIGGEAFLLRTDDGATALFDTGFAYCAEQTLANIYAKTNNQPVDLIVLTHSHYDHCAATSYLVAAMPGVKVASSAHAAYVFTRAGAYKTMNELNTVRAQEKGFGNSTQVVGDISVDIVLEDGDILDIGPLKFRVMSAVGHTKCCIAFWCEEKKLFISSETSGVVCSVLPDAVSAPADVKYMVDLIELVGFNAGMEHIEQVRQLPIEVFVATHYGCIQGADVAAMWRSVDYWRDHIVDLVVGMHKQGRSVDEIIATYKNTFYWGGTAPFQPEAAFDINISYAVPVIIRDCCGEEVAS